jgi:hypothetical protein
MPSSPVAAAMEPPLIVAVPFECTASSAESMATLPPSTTTLAAASMPLAEVASTAREAVLPPPEFSPSSWTNLCASSAPAGRRPSVLQVTNGAVRRASPASEIQTV